MYTELEAHGSIKKDKVLNLVRDCYLKVKGGVTNGADNIEIIREHADHIFDEVHDLLITKVAGSILSEEDILFGLRLVMVDAFMRCKILEIPTDGG